MIMDDMNYNQMFLACDLTVREHITVATKKIEVKLVACMRILFFNL